MSRITLLSALVASAFVLGACNNEEPVGVAPIDGDTTVTPTTPPTSGTTGSATTDSSTASTTTAPITSTTPSTTTPSGTTTPSTTAQSGGSASTGVTSSAAGTPSTGATSSAAGAIDRASDTAAAQVGQATDSAKAAVGSAAGAAADTASDTVMLAKVKGTLMGADGIDASKINVEVANGRVLLTGRLEDKAQIDRVLEEVRGIEGVREVDNRMTSVS